MIHVYVMSYLNGFKFWRDQLGHIVACLHRDTIIAHFFKKVANFNLLRSLSHFVAAGYFPVNRCHRCTVEQLASFKSRLCG